MIGDEYFDLRSRLGTDLFALGELVRTAGSDADSVAIINNLITGLKDPFVFVVVGEVNVGKSTFLNALFGQDFSKTGVLPTTDKICFFKHGPVFTSRDITPTLVEVEVPCEFLRDFHIVDTPGTNSIESEHQYITERFVPTADLVIFVFSAMNPWGASAWQFLEKVHRAWMRNVVFVLQQCDLRSAEEVQVIVDYMAQLARQRFGRDFPIFPVSAKKAFLARSSGLDRDRLLRESGFHGLEAHISDVVTKNATRVSKLANTLRYARQILDHLAARVHSSLDAARQKRLLIDELQTERSLQAGRTLTKLAPALEATDKDYQDAARRVAVLSHEIISLKAAKKIASDEEAKLDSLDHRLFQDLMTRVGERWRQIALVYAEDHRQFTRFLHSQARSALSLGPLDENRDVEQPAGETRHRFVSRVEQNFRRFVVGLRLDDEVGPALEKARKRSRWVPWSFVPAFVAAGVVWWLTGGQWALALGAAGACLLLPLIAWMLTRSVLARARHALEDKLAQAGGTLHKLLADQISEDTEHTFARFLTILTPAREEAVNREQQLASLAASLHRLHESFADLDRRLQVAGARV